MKRLILMTVTTAMFTIQAHGSTVQFYSGVDTPGVSQTNDKTGDNVLIVAHPWYGTIPGASWVSYGATGMGQPDQPGNSATIPAVTFTNTFTLESLVDYSKFLLLVDDLSNVFLNGSLVHQFNILSAEFTAPEEISLPSGLFQIGTNVITIQGYNAGHWLPGEVDPFGAAWSFTAHTLDVPPAADAPEPGTFVMFGGSLITAALWCEWKRRRVA